MALTLPFLPTNELVAVAWLTQRVPGLAAGQVATTLPRAVDGAVPWVAEGFVQVQMIAGGSPNVDVPVRKPIFQVDCWAATPDDSSKVPWNLANRLAELVREATEQSAATYGKPVTLPANYSGARVQAVYLVTEPMRVLGDPSGYARYTLDLAIDWVRA